MSFNQGDILYYDGTCLINLTESTSGLVLQSGGTGAAPSWELVDTDQLANDAVTSAKISSTNLKDIADLSLSTGDILYYDGSQIDRLQVGDNGQVLTLASGTPSWGDASGAMELIETINITGSPSNVAFTGSLSSNYEDFVVVARNVQVSSSNIQSGIQCYIGSSWVNSGYVGLNNQKYVSSGTTTVDNSFGWALAGISNQYASWGISTSNTDYTSTFTMRIFNVHSTTQWKTFLGQSFGFDSSNNPYSITCSGALQNKGAVTNLRWTLGANNAANVGNMSLYGIKA